MTLRSLPDDLRCLYRRMFERVDPNDRRQESELFQLMRKWGRSNENFEFPTIMAFYAIQKPLVPLSDIVVNGFQETVECMGKRVRSRSCGLLEVRVPSQ